MLREFCRYVVIWGKHLIGDTDSQILLKVLFPSSVWCLNPLFQNLAKWVSALVQNTTSDMEATGLNTAHFIPD